MKSFLFMVVCLVSFALTYFGTVHVLEMFTKPLCPDMVVVAVLVDGCMDGDSHKCDLLDLTVPSSCLMERAVEATQAKQFHFGERMRGEMVL